MKSYSVAISAAVLLMLAGGSLLFASLAAHPRGAVLGVSTADEVNIRDINAHFRSVFGRNPLPSEWAYWIGRIHDKPRLADFLGAMMFHLARGGSPRQMSEPASPRISPLRVGVSSGGTQVLPGEILRYRIRLESPGSHISRGMLETTINAPEVRGIVPPPADDRLLPGGVRRLQHVFELRPHRVYTFEFEVEVPSPALQTTLEVKTTVTGSQMSAARTFSIIGGIDVVALAELNSVFRSVYGRNPTASEWAYWAQRLETDKRDRAALQDTMRFHQLHGISH